MKITKRHEWVTTIEEAKLIQQQLQPEVITQDKLGGIKYVAGVDVGFEEENTISRAAVAILSFPDLQLQEKAIAKRPTTFPYLPGLLSFREIPAVIDALEKISIIPNLILCDGQGLAHPLRFGLACHLGVLLDIPTIGVAKSFILANMTNCPQKKAVGNH
jgi:deoxyribonuclease V